MNQLPILTFYHQIKKWNIIRVFNPQTQKAYNIENHAQMKNMSIQGMYVDDKENILYFCTADLGLHQKTQNIPSLIEYNIDKKIIIGSWPLPGDKTLCNDIASLDTKTLLITDSLGESIYSFDRDQRSFNVWLRNQFLAQGNIKANGITYSKYDNAVYFVLFEAGKLFKVLLDDQNQAADIQEIKLPHALNGADAIRPAGKNRVIVFENGLIKGSGGQITSIAIDDLAVLLGFMKAKTTQLAVYIKMK